MGNRTNRLTNLEAALPPGRDLEIRVVFEETIVDPITDERRRVPIIVPPEELECVSTWQNADGSRTRVLQPRADVPKSLTAGSSENAEPQVSAPRGSIVPQTDVCGTQVASRTMGYARHYRIFALYSPIARNRIPTCRNACSACGKGRGIPSVSRTSMSSRRRSVET